MNQFLSSSDNSCNYKRKVDNCKPNFCNDIIPCLYSCIGVVGPTGPAEGPAGTSGILGFADFYALMSPDNAAALTITPVSGGTEPVSAHLVITQI